MPFPIPPRPCRTCSHFPAPHKAQSHKAQRGQPTLRGLCSTPGVNGAGKTTQLQIIMGRLFPDSGEVVKARRNMRIAYLAQVR
jgi:ABC-type Na+ transport system ATPase subunit NatA